ncbi:rhodanese-like domain-containing protein [Dichelobacter nodosus]|uniref:Rhodanese-like domain protein n=2 Tax=Dichelobacter nodosus TaxID=870 RepID=A5EXC3_DICNV|nr:rhodanese-like domain protein [Dichelobacter nodosus VCS1703A]
MTLTQFIQANWFLVFLLTIVIIAIIICEILQRKKSGKAVSNLLATQLINDGAILIDTRTVEEFKRGHIANAKNVPMDKFQEYLQNNPINQQDIFVLYCATGLSARKQAQLLIEQGAQHVYFLDAGMMGWREENLPIV